MKQITKNKINQIIETLEKKDNWFVLLLTKPSLYLFSLLKRTLIIGVVLFFIVEISLKLGLKEQVIPVTWHSVAGIVIGLLLVFRTNTAYDRWWEARKIFASLESSFIFIRINLSKVNPISEKRKEEMVDKLKTINKLIFDFTAEDDRDKSSELKKSFVMFIHGFKLDLSELLKSESITAQDYVATDKKIMDIMDYFCSLERIKDTPIPTSYSLHIKISLFAYLLSLPFGLFFGFGMLSIPLVMVLFFVIAGIEIISNEIENPFKGDPNDLPIEEFKEENEKYIVG
jgi:putative membrane protein